MPERKRFFSVDVFLIPTEHLILANYILFTILFKIAIPLPQWWWCLSIGGGWGPHEEDALVVVIILASDWTYGMDTIASGSHLRALPAAFTWNAFLSHQFCLLFARFVTAALLQIYNRKCCFDFTNITAQLLTLFSLLTLFALLTQWHICLHNMYNLHILLYG